MIYIGWHITGDFIPEGSELAHCRRARARTSSHNQARGCHRKLIDLNECKNCHVELWQCKETCVDLSGWHTKRETK